MDAGEEAALEENRQQTLKILDEVLKNDNPADESSVEEDESRQRERVSKKADTAKSRKLFIGGLPWKADPETVEEFFEQYGEIDSFNMPINKSTGVPMGIAFIVYSKQESVDGALAYDGKTYGGQKLRVRRADPEAKGKGAGRGRAGLAGDGAAEAAEDHRGSGWEGAGWKGAGKAGRGRKGTGKGSKGSSKGSLWHLPKRTEGEMGSEGGKGGRKGERQDKGSEGGKGGRKGKRQDKGSRRSKVEDYSSPAPPRAADVSKDTTDVLRAKKRKKQKEGKTEGNKEGENEGAKKKKLKKAKRVKREASSHGSPAEPGARPRVVRKRKRASSLPVI